MKILGGSARGMNLFSPPGMNTRPMNARVKESVFNILGQYLEGTMFDLFAGSGSLGIEALSRGADYCYFVESSPKTLPILQKNIEKAKFDQQAKILRSSAFDLVKNISEIKFDICFFDPPYRYFDSPVERTKILSLLEKIAVTFGKEEAQIVTHYRRGAMAGVNLPSSLQKYDQRVYGTSEILFLELSNTEKH